MNETTSKEKVLKKIRNALINKLPNPFGAVDFDSAVHLFREEDPSVIFVEEFTAAGGKFLYCENEDELMENLHAVVSDQQFNAVFCLEEKLRYMLNKAEIPATSEPDALVSSQAALTYCDYLIARTGSILLSSGSNSGRKLHAIPDAHLVVSYASQMVNDLRDALRKIKSRSNDGEMPSEITVVTGPSRTADIEKTLVMGAHGPKDVYLFFVDDLI